VLIYSKKLNECIQIPYMSSNVNTIVYKNIREFLNYRGTKHTMSDLSDKEIQDLFLSDGYQKFTGDYPDGSKITVVVYTFLSRHVKGSKEFMVSVNTLKASSTHEVLIVLGDGIPAKSILKFTTLGNAKMENVGRVVGYNLFRTNLPTVAIVPPHRALSEEEAKFIEQHFYMGRENISSHILWQTDPACIWCGAARGDIVEIRRQNDTSGECVDYRLCV
jgi:DNA-directed RNA polymerase subunit H (RpoH/RPB5)